MAEVEVDFEVHERLGGVAREYGLAGTVQHGASTLPDELFHRFREVETAEIHLATGFQNAALRAPGVPAGAPRADRGMVLRERRSTSASPTRPTSSSSTRRARRRSGRSSAQLWDLETKDEILAAQAEDRLPVHRARRRRHRAMVERYVEPVEWHRPIPAALAEASPRADGSRAGATSTVSNRQPRRQRALTARGCGAILPRRSRARARGPGADRPRRPACHPRGQLAPAVRW